MSDEEETIAENEEDLWAAAADDLAQQREMLRDAAGKEGDEKPPAESGGEDKAQPSAPAPPAAPSPPALSPETRGDLDRILDIPLHISVELGRTKMLINDLLQLGQGSVIELSKLVGEPLEVLVNSSMVAKGEVVVVNEKFGIRITEISPAKERIKSLS